MLYLELYPLEIQNKIIYYLDYNDFTNLLKVNKKFIYCITSHELDYKFLNNIKKFDYFEQYTKHIIRHPDYLESDEESEEEQIINNCFFNSYLGAREHVYIMNNQQYKAPNKEYIYNKILDCIETFYKHKQTDKEDNEQIIITYYDRTNDHIKNKFKKQRITKYKELKNKLKNI